MRPFRILHVEEDLECNFLLSEALRKEKHIKIQWSSNRSKTREYLDKETFDLIICTGVFSYWKKPYKEVIDLSKGQTVVLYSARCDLLSKDFLNYKGSHVFQKSSEGTHNLINYIKEKSKGEM